VSSFWQKKLGLSPQQAPAPQQATQSSGPRQPWWAEPAPPPPPENYQQQQNPYGDQPTPGVQDASFAAVVRGGVVPANTSAKSARSTARCPECDSTNYAVLKTNKMSKDGVRLVTERCYDCGYPVEQSASGDHTRSIATPGQQIDRAKQLPQGGFSGQFVGRVS
jgi:hypothetical protein